MNLRSIDCAANHPAIPPSCDLKAHGLTIAAAPTPIRRAGVNEMYCGAVGDASRNRSRAIDEYGDARDTCQVIETSITRDAIAILRDYHCERFVPGFTSVWSRASPRPIPRLWAEGFTGRITRPATAGRYEHERRKGARS